MRNIVIVGSGAVAAEVSSYIEDNNKHIPVDDQLQIRGYLEFEENITKYWSRYQFQQPVLGDIHNYQIQENDHFIVGIANIGVRKEMVGYLNKRACKTIDFVHYTSIIATSARIGKGNIIYPHCIVGPNTNIGEHNLLTSYSFVSHDCSLGNFNLFSTSGIGGNVKVGSENFLGIRATILPHVSVGDGNIIQAGMIVDKNLGDGSTIFHRFKEKVIAVRKENDGE